MNSSSLVILIAVVLVVLGLIKKIKHLITLAILLAVAGFVLSYLGITPALF